MDKTYEAEPLKRTVRRGGGGGVAFLDALKGLFEKIGDVFPSDIMRNNRKTTFLLGGVGVIVLVLIVSGIMVINKLTQPGSPEDADQRETVGAQTQVQPEPAPEKEVPVVKGEIPSPPDMYFD